MGMLQLAGVVSGGGKALQQGLQQTQQYMSQSMLLKEREEMERARMDITYGREVGLMRERQKFDLERDDRQHSRTMELAKQREEFEMRKGDVERKASREDATTQFERQKERDVTSKVLDASYDQQKEATRSKEDRAKEARDRQAKREEQQANIGKEIVTETIRNQRPHAGGTSGEASGKWDDQTKARYKSLVAEIADIKESLYGLVKAPEKEHPALKKRLDALQREHDELVGRQSTPSARQPIRWPE